MRQYYGIQRKAGSDIEHWKYIKKEYVNGKPRYYYDKYADKTKFSETKNTDGEKVVLFDEIHNADTDKLFSKTRLITSKTNTHDDNTHYVNRNIYRDRGKIERAINKAQKKVERVAYNAIYDDDSLSSTVKAGRNAVANGLEYLSKKIRPKH